MNHWESRGSKKINGVAAAGQFTLDGKLVEYKANIDISKEMAEMTAPFCATISMMFNALAGASYSVR